MEYNEGLKLIATYAVIVGFNRMYYHHSQPVFICKAEVGSVTKEDGRDGWKGQKFIFDTTVLSGKRTDFCQAQITALIRESKMGNVETAVGGWCLSPVDVMHVNGYGNVNEELDVRLYYSDNSNASAITAEQKRRWLSLKEFPISELPNHLNQRVEVRLKDWRFVEGRLNYFGESSAKRGDHFVVIDCGITATVHVSEIAQAWTINRRPGI